MIVRLRVCVWEWLAAFARRTDGREKKEGLEHRMQIVEFYRTAQTKPETVSCGGKIRVCTVRGKE